MPRRMLAPLLILTAIAVIAGISFCLLYGDDAPGRDLCHAMAVTAIILVSASALIPTAYVFPAAVSAYHRDPSDLSAPPPKA